MRVIMKKLFTVMMKILFFLKLIGWVMHLKQRIQSNNYCYVPGLPNVVLQKYHHKLPIFLHSYLQFCSINFHFVLMTFHSRTFRSNLSQLINAPWFDEWRCPNQLNKYFLYTYFFSTWLGLKSLRCLLYCIFIYQDNKKCIFIFKSKAIRWFFKCHLT